MGAAPIELRPLFPEDAALFREIRLEGLQRSPDAFSSTFEIESAQPLAFFEERIGRSTVFGAFRESELLGVAGLAVQQGPKHGHKGLLWGMYVRSEARKAGLGRRLVQAVIEHARKHVELVQLSVVSENQPARRLYASLGFEEYGIERRGAKYLGRYHDDVLMVKMLVLESGTDPAAQGGVDHR